MQKKGYVKLYRKIQDWGWFQDGNMLKVMLWLIINANTQDSEYRGIPVRRGSLVTSLKDLTENLSGSSKNEKISIQQMRTIVKRLTRTGEILVSSTNAFTLITICKYDVYQGNNTLFESESTNEQQTDNNQLTFEQQHSKNIRIQEDNILHTHTREDLLISEEEYANIKRRYNADFESVFRPCQRLTLNARLAIRQCLEMFGRGSLDTVFKQLKQSAWLTGAAPSGWTPDILWIFTTANYERILSGYYSSKPAAKKTKPQHVETTDFTVPTKEERQAAEQRKYEETRNRWLGNIRLAEEDPTSSVYKTVVNAWKSGTLRQYGINWQPPQPQSLPPTPPPKPQHNPDVKVTQQDISYINNILNRH